LDTQAGPKQKNGQNRRHKCEKTDIFSILQLDKPKIRQFIININERSSKDFYDNEHNNRYQSLLVVADAAQSVGSVVFSFS